MADNRHVRFRELLPAHVLRRIDDEQGSVPMFSPSVVAAGASSTDDEYPPRRRPHRFENGIDWGSNKENNSPYVPPSLLTLSTPTPRKAKLRTPTTSAGWGTSPAPSCSSSSSSAASQETAFFTPVAKSGTSAFLLDDDGDDNNNRGPPRNDNELEARGDGYGRHHLQQQQEQTPKEETTVVVDESFTPFSGITQSTIRSTMDFSSATHHNLMGGVTNGTAASSRRLRELQSAFTPTHSVPSASKGRAATMSIMATTSSSFRNHKESPRQAMVGSSPYKSLPRLDMLTSTYLSSCHDAPTLRRVIQVLQSEGGERTYPQLLEIANTRLNDVLAAGGSVPRRRTTVLPTQSSADRHPPGANTNWPNDSLTLSTDSGDEVSSLQLLRESLEKQRYSYPRPSPSMIAQYSPSSNAPQAALMQQRLRQSEDKLQRTVQEVEGLQQLLQSTSLQYDQSTTELQEAIATLQARLDRQRISNEKSQSEAESYKSRALQLTHQLERQKRDHDQIRIALENKQNQLSEFLRASQRNADGVTAERTDMLRRMMHAMSSDVGLSSDAQVEKLTKEERSAIVANFCDHLADSKAQLEELAAVVRGTEKERRKILKAYNQVKKNYIETHNCMVGLERDNYVLSNEIESLAQQLREAQRHNAEIETKQSGFDKRQQDANTVIRRLKEQIRSTEAMVPIGVYKSALENADVEAAKAEQYRTRVAALTKQVASLSARLTHEGKTLPPPPPPPSSTRALQPKQPLNSVQRNPVRPLPSPKSVTPLENKPPLSINTFQTDHDQTRVDSRKAVSFAPDLDSTVEAPKSASKMAKLRAAGGRKALTEQLRKARSPRNQLP